MGYRSNVYMRIHGSDLIKFNALLAEHWEEGEIEMISDIDEEGYSRFEIHSIKWYDSYDPVACINKLINDSKVSHLLRIGEDDGDIEYMGEDPYDVFDIRYEVSY